MKRRTALVLLLVLLASCATAPTTSGGGATSVGSRVQCPATSSWAVGDSLTIGSGGVIGWPDVAPSAGLYANLGVVGWTIPQIAALIESDLMRCGETGASLPSRIVLMAGTNDLGGAHSSVATMTANVTPFIDYVVALGISLTILPVPPIGAGSPWSNMDGHRIEYNAWLAATYPAQFLDCATALQNPSGPWMLPAYALGDGTHMTQLGQDTLSACVTPTP